MNLRPEFSDPPNPKAQALLGSLTDTLLSTANGVTGFKAIQSRYSTCMKSAGLDVREPGGLYDIAEVKVNHFINGADPYSDEYRALLPKARAIEVRIDKVDVKCRAPLADDIAQLLAPELDDWSGRNRKQIQEAAKGW